MLCKSALAVHENPHDPTRQITKRTRNFRIQAMRNFFSILRPKFGRSAPGIVSDKIRLLLGETSLFSEKEICDKSQREIEQLHIGKEKSNVFKIKPR